MIVMWGLLGPTNVSEWLFGRYSGYGGFSFDNDDDGDDDDDDAGSGVGNDCDVNVHFYQLWAICRQ